MYLKLLWLSLVLTFISCKTSNDQSTINLEQNETWPKTQESIDQFSTHYEAFDHLIANFKYDRIAVKKDGKWGLVDRENRLYFPFEYDTIISNTGFVALKKENVYDVYDSTRTLIVSIENGKLKPVMSNFFASIKNGKMALYNPNGLMIRDYEFDDLSGPVNESYFLGLKNGKWSAYDLVGEPLNSNDKAKLAVKFLNDYQVTLRSYGPLVLGMNKRQIEREIGMELVEIEQDASCAIYSFGDDFLDVKLMINNTNGENLLERIYFFNPHIKTKSGIGVNSTKAELLEAYGDKIEARKNVYNEASEDLYYVPTDRKDKAYRLYFLENNDEISTYSVGRLPSIEYPEMCK